MADECAAENATEKADAMRAAATGIVRTLRDAGFEAYFAGGCVRDRLLGLSPTEYDVATAARPQHIADLFKRVRHVGESFGVTLVRHKGFTVEVATFRTDGVYSDHRHPDSVTYSDAEHDAQRRDFTINGLFEDPLEDRIIDFVGGRDDLEAKVLRAIGDPDQRLREDRLRMLRGVRFAARFGFALEGATADAIRRSARDLDGVSRERIGNEVRRMLCGPNRGVAAWELQYLGLDAEVLKEPNMAVAPTRVGRLPEDAAFSTALAAWLLDRHEEDLGQMDSRTEQLDRQLYIAQRWGRALVLSNDEQAAFRRCLEIHWSLTHDWDQLGVARQKRLAASEQFDQALLLVQAMDRPAFVDIRRRVIALAETELAPEPLLTGDDLVNAGFEPGPEFRHLLDAVYDAQLEGSLHSRAEALEMARAIARTRDS